MKTIGLDFDNTLTNYDRLFYQTAKDLKLIPDHIQPNKVEIRNFLRSKNREEDFTFLQGKVYGLRIAEADQAKGMFNALLDIQKNGYKLKIISHKTKYPIKGDKYDLHKGATNWLIKNNFFGKNGLNLKSDDIFFEVTKELKIQRIKDENCSVFIDDLPEILDNIDNDIYKILYSPGGKNKNGNFKCMENWEDLKLILN